MNQDKDPHRDANLNTVYFGSIPTKVDCNMVFTLPLIFGPKHGQPTAMEPDVDDPNIRGHGPILSRMRP